jgi:hypothetical protein
MSEQDISEGNTFEWDIFISYSHIDNQHYSDYPQGWIDYLQERLEIRLAQLLGRTPNIWRDKRNYAETLSSKTRLTMTWRK